MAAVAPATAADAPVWPFEVDPDPAADESTSNEAVETSDAPEPDDQEPPSPAVHRHTSKAEEKLEKALAYVTDLNEGAHERGHKWFVSESLLADLTGCYRPAVKRFVADRQDPIDALNRHHGLGSGHNRGRSRTRPEAFPELVKTFRESVLNPSGVEQPF